MSKSFEFSEEFSASVASEKDVLFNVNTDSVRTRIRKKEWVGVFPFPWI